MAISPSDILRVLRGCEIPRERRKSVRKSNSDPKRGMCLGYVTKYDTGFVASQFTREAPELSRVLCRFAAEQYPNFKFSSIMVNEGGSGLHVDKGNLGPSLIMSVGDHVGGELWQYPNVTLRIKNRLRPCDGRLPHITLPFEGERYSIVYFTMKAQAAPPAPVERALLRSCGFRAPNQNSSDDRATARSDLLPHAAHILRKEWGLHKSYIGDYTNKSLKKR